MLEGTGIETRLDMGRLLKARNYFKKIRPRYKEFLSDITGVETEIFQSQIPGGMISNMESQLKQQGAGDKLEEVLLEVPRVRKVSGFPPLVTPSSQIVGTQAVLDVYKRQLQQHGHADTECHRRQLFRSGCQQHHRHLQRRHQLHRLQ